MGPLGVCVYAQGEKPSCVGRRDPFVILTPKVVCSFAQTLGWGRAKTGGAGGLMPQRSRRVGFGLGLVLTRVVKTPDTLSGIWCFS